MEKKMIVIGNVCAKTGLDAEQVTKVIEAFVEEMDKLCDQPKEKGVFSLVSEAIIG